MIRFLCRFVGLCLLATAFVLFVYDGTKSIANHDLLYTRLDDVWAIIDQNSLNGTFLNGHRLIPQQKRVLRSGDELQLGYLTIRVRFES